MTDPKHHIGRLDRAFLIIVATLCASACQSDSGNERTKADPCKPQIQAAVSLDIRGSVPAVAVTIDGRPGTMILDTGAESTLLTTDAIKRLGIRFDFNRRATVQGVGPAMKTVLARIDKLELGGLALRGHALVVGGVQLPNLPGSQPDGLLGGDIISAYDVDLDMPQSSMTLYRTAQACPIAKPPWKERFVILNGLRVRNKLLIPIEVDGKELAAAVDTGASAGVVIDRAAAIRAGLVTEASLVGDKRVQTGGVTSEKVGIYVHRFNEVKIGADSIRNPLLPVASLPGDKVDALIGAAYLKRRHIWLSYSAARIFIAVPP